MSSGHSSPITFAGCHVPFVFVGRCIAVPLLSAQKTLTCVPFLGTQ